MAFRRQLLQACAKFTQHLEIRTTPSGVRNSHNTLNFAQQPMRGAKSPLFLPTPHEIFSYVFFDVISFLILVTNQSQAFAFVNTILGVEITSWKI